MTKEARKWLLEKAHKASLETGKGYGAAVLMWLLLVCIAAILAFGRGTEAHVPLLGVKLPRIPAAEFALVLSCAAVFRMILLENFLGKNTRLFGALMEEEHGLSPRDYHIGHPTLFYCLQTHPESWQKTVLWIMMGLIIVGGFFVVPIMCAITLAGQAGYTAGWIAMVSASVVFLTGTFIAITAQKRVRLSADLDAGPGDAP